MKWILQMQLAEKAWAKYYKNSKKKIDTVDIDGL